MVISDINRTNHPTRVMIVDSCKDIRNAESKLFSQIFENCSFIKYAFINEAFINLDNYFHIDFFLINAYCTDGSCSSIVKKIRNMNHFNTSTILISVDSYVSSAYSRMNIIRYCSSFRNVILIEKPITALNLSKCILKLIPSNIHYFKTLEILNKEMKYQLDLCHVKKYKHKQEPKTRPRTNSDSEIKLPEIKSIYKNKNRFKG